MEKKKEKGSPHLDTISDPRPDDATSLRWSNVSPVAWTFPAPAPRHRNHDTCQPPVSAKTSRHKCTLCGKSKTARRPGNRGNGQKTKKNTSSTVADSRSVVACRSMACAARAGRCGIGAPRPRLLTRSACHPTRPYIVGAVQTHCPSLKSGDARLKTAVRGPYGKTWKLDGRSSSHSSMS